MAIDEQKAAGSFSSAYPNFVRIMKKFNISGSYTLVSNFGLYSANICVGNQIYMLC